MNSAEINIQEQHLFGRWRFDSNTGELFDGETTTRLEPQVAKLLDYFLSHQNTLTSRDDLIAAVWENRIVSDDAINRCVSILRQTLSPDDKNAYIETIVRRGYISHFPASPVTTRHAGQSSRRNKYLILAALTAVVAVAFYSVVGKLLEISPQLQGARREGPPMVAVLPFASFGLEDDNEFFVNGIHDDLLTRLAQLQSIRVISRTSVLEYRDSKRNIRQIGRELGADAILEGGIQRIGDRIRINAQLIDARTDGHLWAGQYDRELQPEKIFDIQTEITQAIVSALQTTLTEQDTTQLSVLPTQNMAAYRAYHRAMKIRDAKTLTDPDVIAALEDAVTLDPDFVLAWAELAGSLSFENFSQQDPDSIQRIEKILEKIRALAPESADYLLAQSYFTYYILKDYEQAYQLINRAQILRPSDIRVLELKSWIQRRLGDFEGKIEMTRLARALDPNNQRWTIRLAYSLLAAHHYDEASREIESLVSKDYRSSVLHSTLELRNHHDPARWLEALLAIQTEFANYSNPQDLWGAYIAVRDYAMAENMLNAAETKQAIKYNRPIVDSGVDINRIITLWFLQAGDRLDLLLQQERSKLEEQRNADGSFPLNSQNLAMAFVTAAEGNTEEAERLVRVWRRGAVTDLAELANVRHISCRALGMAAATSAAVECIRSGLIEPSYVIPFIEPFLPYYDSIRDEPEFVGLLADIQGKVAGLDKH